MFPRICWTWVARSRFSSERRSRDLVAGDYKITRLKHEAIPASKWTSCDICTAERRVWNQIQWATVDLSTGDRNVSWREIATTEKEQHAEGTQAETTQGGQKNRPTPRSTGTAHCRKLRKSGGASGQTGHSLGLTRGNIKEWCPSRRLLLRL